MSGKQKDLASNVAEAILIANSIGHALIEVEEIDGTVTLKGTVESQQASLTALALVQEQEGVVQVINQLKIVGVRSNNL